MRKIIFLNGCGSSGKTSIKNAIQIISDELWISFGVDSFIDMLPYIKEKDYFNYITDYNEQGPITKIQTTFIGRKFFDIMPEFAKLFVDNGQNIIIDEVLLDDELLRRYANCLKNYTSYYIGVFCDLKIMQEREALRKDRATGLSNAQINIVHSGIKGKYDFTVDTTNISSFHAARQILAHVESNHNPQAFNDIRNGKD